MMHAAVIVSLACAAVLVISCTVTHLRDIGVRPSLRDGFSLTILLSESAYLLVLALMLISEYLPRPHFQVAKLCCGIYISAVMAHRLWLLRREHSRLGTHQEALEIIRVVTLGAAVDDALHPPGACRPAGR